MNDSDAGAELGEAAPERGVDAIEIQAAVDRDLGGPLRDAVVGIAVPAFADAHTEPAAIHDGAACCRSTEDSCAHVCEAELRVAGHVDERGTSEIDAAELDASATAHER